jgi:hypothetical protein
VAVADAAAGLAGEGLDFSAHEVPRIVGVVASRNAVVDGFQLAVGEVGSGGACGEAIKSTLM